MNRNNNVLDEQTLQSLRNAYEESNPQRSRRQINSNNSFPIEEARRALSHIPREPGYDIWRNIVWSVGSEYPFEVARDLIINWSPDDQDGAVIERLLRDNDGRLSIGIMLGYAKEHGYVIPTELKNCTLKPGPAVFKHVYNYGLGYKAIGEDLYHYEDGYYQKVNDHHEIKKIIEFLGSYVTNYKIGKCGYASHKNAKEALEYLKGHRQVIPPEVVNPPGLNLNNGFLAITYGPDNQVNVELREHSPEIICTYKAEFDYDPDANSDIFTEAIGNILRNEEERKILLRTLAASLGLPKVREVLHRPVRALVLEGGGSNGKDTVKEWLDGLYGGKGITSIPIAAFKKADNGHYEALCSLPNSRINWASENSSAQLDTCETLKSAITGDSILVRSLYQNLREERPKAIFLFNTNSRMQLNRLGEAVESRFAFIPFRNIFRSNPDPNKPNEIQADPRLKEDKQYIRENILPAFLNILLVKYQEVLNEGINYEVCSEALNEIVRENNHLYQFIDDVGLVECSIDEGFLRPAEILDRYREWALDEDLSVDRNNHDRMITDVRQMTKRLKEIFPNLQQFRDSSGNRLRLRFTSDNNSDGDDDLDLDDD